MDDLKEAEAALEAEKTKAAADKAALEKAFEATKDLHTNYAYIMSLVPLGSAERKRS